ncbi:MAG TPA: DMT family transporter [Thermoplasmata archaeon]|nr:DMT family transporter [Thermoplasmata archaeon]HEV2429832.1 DMT family transporter [Thermoplasmata archaeon]
MTAERDGDRRGPSGRLVTPPTQALRLSWVDLLLLVALAIAWGSAYLFIREGLVFGAGPLLFASSRYLLSAAAFAALAAVRREPFPDRTSLLVSAGVGGILIIGLYGALLYVGELNTTGGYASVLSASAPILTVVIAYAVIPAERLGRTGQLGLGLGFAGVVVLVLPSLGQGAIGTWPGPELVLAAFVSAALGTVWLRRIGRGRQGLWQIGTQFAVAGAFVGGGAALDPAGEALPLTPPVLEALAALVVLSSVVGYFVYFTLHHRVGPVRANLVAYLLPLVGVGIGTGLLGEPASIFELGGFVIVIAGLTLILREASRGPASDSGATGRVDPGSTHDPD